MLLWSVPHTPTGGILSNTPLHTLKGRLIRSKITEAMPAITENHFRTPNYMGVKQGTKVQYPYTLLKEIVFSSWAKLKWFSPANHHRTKLGAHPTVYGGKLKTGIRCKTWNRSVRVRVIRCKTGIRCKTVYCHENRSTMQLSKRNNSFGKHFPTPPPVQSTWLCTPPHP